MMMQSSPRPRLIPAGSGDELENAVGIDNKGQNLVEAGTGALVLNPNEVPTQICGG